MHFRLRDNLHYCVAGGRTIVLDLEADRYLALPAGMDAAFARAAGGTCCGTDDAAVLRPILNGGMLLPQQDPPGITGRCAIVSASRDLARVEAGPFRPIVCMHAAASQVCAGARLRTCSLLTIRHKLQRYRSRIAARRRIGSDREFSEIAAAFAALDPIFPRAERCLVRSLAFLDLCLSRKLAPDLVFGVQAAPFSAHCWVQQDDAVLNDVVENVRPFTPIMVM